MSPNNEILLNGFLKSKLLSIFFASSFFINLDPWLLHAAHFDDRIVLLVLVYNTFESTSFVVFCTLNKMSTCFIMTCV